MRANGDRRRQRRLIWRALLAVCCAVRRWRVVYAGGAVRDCCWRRAANGNAGGGVAWRLLLAVLALLAAMIGGVAMWCDGDAAAAAMLRWRDALAMAVPMGRCDDGAWPMRAAARFVLLHRCGTRLTGWVTRHPGNQHFGSRLSEYHQRQAAGLPAANGSA